MQIKDREPRTVKEERDKYCEHIPQIYQNVYRKAMQGKSLRAAINAKCQDCTNWQRKEIENCLVTTCSLFPYRPYQKKAHSVVSGSKVGHDGVVNEKAVIL